MYVSHTMSLTHVFSKGGSLSMLGRVYFTLFFRAL